MEAVTPNEVVTVVTIGLNHPTQQGESMLMTFVFDRQPQVEDVIRAYASDNFLKKHPHYNDYGPVLMQCLKAYGVPQMYELNMQDAEGWPVQTPMVTARWQCNLLGRKESTHNYEFGFIRVYVKGINIVPRPEIKAQAEMQDKVKRASKPTAAQRAKAKK